MNENRQNGIRIGCALMAAGRAERFGRNKLMEKLDGSDLVGRVLLQMRLLSELCRERKAPILIPDLLTVTRWEEVAELSKNSGIQYVLYEGGEQSDSIRSVLSVPQAEQWQGCMFIPGDQPFLTAAGMERLLLGFAAQPEKVHRLGWHTRPGSPVLFPARFFQDLRELKGDTGGRILFQSGKIPVVTHQAGSKKELTDIDTQKDLEKIRQKG